MPTDTNAVIDAVTSFLSAVNSPPVETIEEGRAVAVRHGYVIHDIEHMQNFPARATAVFTAHDAESFAAYVNRFQIPETVVFCDADARSFTAIVDYHAVPIPANGERGTPMWCAHRAVFAPKLSIEWARWSGIDGKALPQREFARFIAENRIDIVAPDAATILEIAEALSVTRKTEFRSGVSLRDGTQRLTYAETDEVSGARTGEMTVPETFRIRAPVFFRGEASEIDVFFRYRIAEGKLSFLVDMHRREHVEFAAFECESAAVRALLDPATPMLMGRAGK